MPVHDRWFLLPAVASDEPDGVRPKYADHADVAGFSGNTISSSTAGTYHPALVQQHPDVDPWYIVRFYGEDDPGWAALNEIHNHTDTRTLADHATDVAPVLDGRFPGLDRTGQEWADSFRVNA